MTRRLPPIFAKVRFRLPTADVPRVVVRFTKEQIDHARQTIAEMVEDCPLYTYAHCWLETPWLGILVHCPTDEVAHIRSWNRDGKHPTSFTLSSFTERGLSDLEIIVKAQYFQAAYTLHLHTERAAEVSVNTRTRNAPSAFVREGDTLRYARMDDLASAAGQARQRDYQRPEAPSGIQMREHDVRGHWRTFSSGVRVWVRPHKRGNAELGHVTRVVT